MQTVTKISVLFTLLFLVACVSSDGSGNLETTLLPSAQPAAELPQQSFALDLNQQPLTQSAYQSTPIIGANPAATPVYVQRVSKTYLINGLASNVGAIGYGFTNLQKKIPGSVLHSYASPLESSTIIRSQVIKELKAAYRSNPNLDINLIGISYGANIVTQIAANLGRSGIAVNYLATLEGPAMSRIGPKCPCCRQFQLYSPDLFPHDL